LDFHYPPKAEEFRNEVRAFLDQAVTPEYLEERRTMVIDFDGHGPATQKFVDQLYERGYLTMHWPKEYGGQDRPFLDRTVFVEEMARAGATTNTLGLVGLNIVAPALMHYGTEEQKRTFLPRIATGEWIFCQLFTEPEAGSDLANLKTTAIRDGDVFIVNGTKTFTTRAHMSDHGYLLARTDLGAERHRGMSLFIVDMKTPGMDVRPMILANKSRHNMVYMENVQVPASSMLGELNRGWYHAMVSFDFERSGALAFVIERERVLKGLIEYAKTTNRRGKPLGKEPAIRKKLVEAVRDVRVGRALGTQVIDLYGNNRVPNVESSQLNMQQKDSAGRFAETEALVYGSYGQLEKETYQSIDGAARGWWQLAGRHSAGTVEIQRNVIAQRGLGLPR
jgi:alkylation response protein AidB-like acyl-CoA dehydrogenase